MNRRQVAINKLIGRAIALGREDAWIGAQDPEQIRAWPAEYQARLDQLRRSFAAILTANPEDKP